VNLVPGYRALRLLRNGEATAVYDAWSEERGCRCVLKVLRPRRAGRDGERALEAEGRLLLALSHPHIVRAYALVRRPRVALVLETLPGETLSHLLGRRRRRLAAADVAQLGLQLASALRYLHQAGMLHLDLKPSNVVCHAGLAKLLDLGIARSPGPGRRGVGTAGYLAPEQARGGALTAATDVFGLGGVLYEASTGRAAFDAAPRHRTQRAGPARPVSAERRLPPLLAHAIDASLSLDQAARPSLDELARALAAAAGPSRRAR